MVLNIKCLNYKYNPIHLYKGILGSSENQPSCFLHVFNLQYVWRMAITLPCSIPSRSVKCNSQRKFNCSTFSTKQQGSPFPAATMVIILNINICYGRPKNVSAASNPLSTSRTSLSQQLGHQWPELFVLHIFMFLSNFY